MDRLLIEKMRVQIMLVCDGMMKSISINGFSIFNIGIYGFRDVNWQTQTMVLRPKVDFTTNATTVVISLIK